MIALTSIMIMLFLGILGTSFNYMTATRLAGATEDLGSAQAFYVAEGGLQYTAMKYLNGDSDYSDNVSPTGDPFGGTPVTLGEGQFWVEYSDQVADSITVKVTARVGNAVRAVQVSAGQDSTGFNFVTLAGGNINMNDSTGDLFGDVGITGQANIDEDVTVHGDITEDPTLEIPTMDMGIYEGMCDETHVGNKTFNADYTGDLCVTGNVIFNDNVTYTGVLYVGGNVTISGDNVVINGSIVSEGNLNGDNRSGLQFNAQPGPDPGTHMPAIVTNGIISLKNDDGMQVNGVIWSDGNIDLTNSDNVNYTGSFITNGNLIANTTLNFQLTFDADLLVGVPGLGELGEGAGTAVSFSNWRTFAPW